MGAGSPKSLPFCMGLDTRPVPKDKIVFTEKEFTMKKRFFAIVLAAVMMIAAIVPAAAYTVKQQNTADALNELGLFQGMGPAVGYALDQNLTRAQGITLLVRMIGKEAEALEGTYRTPFVDVPAWAAGYVGYAYTNAITNGMGPDKFGSDVQLNDYMFLTLVLRALGYSDAGENAQFTWNDPYELAKKVGLIDIAAADGSFTRGDAVDVFWKAMSAEIVGKNMTLAQSLIEQGIFTAEQFAAAEVTQVKGRVESVAPVTPVTPEQDKDNNNQSQDKPADDDENSGGSIFDIGGPNETEPEEI